MKNNTLSHTAMWEAIDKLAEHFGLSPSGLAKKAGLDATAFNPSKRVLNDGRLRWPSTESIAKVLESVNITFEAFARVAMGGQVRDLPNAYIPLVHLKELTKYGLVPHMMSTSEDQILLPDPTLGNLVAVDVRSAHFEPIFSVESLLILAPNSEIRTRDRILIKTKEDLLLRTLVRRTTQRIEVKPLLSNISHTLANTDVVWMARIVWASQ